MTDKDRPAARSGRDVRRDGASGEVPREDSRAQRDGSATPEGRDPRDELPDDGSAGVRSTARQASSAAAEKVASHPLGAVAGGMGGAALGALGGVAAGPVGSLAGAIAGAVMGAGAGSDSSVASGPVVEGADASARWRAHWQGRSWGEGGTRYEDYAAAYEYGADAAADASAEGRTDRSWDEVEPGLERGWTQRRGDSALEWPQVREAVREAWQHVREVAARVPPGDLRR